MAEESDNSGIVPVQNYFNAEPFLLIDHGLILREAGVYLTLKELGNYLTICQPVRRLMISDETYAQRFWHAVGIKELGEHEVYDHQWGGGYVNVGCKSFHDIPVMKSFIKLIVQPEITKGCFISLSGPEGRKSLVIRSEYDRAEQTRQFFKKRRRVECLQ